MGETQKEKAAVFDIDGTLLNIQKRLEISERESNGNKKLFWQIFLSEKYLDLDTPNERVIKFLQEKWQEDIKVIIVTGRTRNMERYTYYQLSTFNIPWNEAYFRSKGDFRKDYEYKSEIMKKLMQKYEILFIIDDSEEVRKAIEQMGIKAIDPALIS